VERGIELAPEEAGGLNCNYYSSERFFFGGLCEGMAAGILNNFGCVALERVKEELILPNRCLCYTTATHGDYQSSRV